MNAISEIYDCGMHGLSVMHGWLARWPRACCAFTTYMYESLIHITSPSGNTLMHVYAPFKNTLTLTNVQRDSTSTGVFICGRFVLTPVISDWIFLVPLSFSSRVFLRWPVIHKLHWDALLLITLTRQHRDTHFVYARQRAQRQTSCFADNVLKLPRVFHL